VKDELIEVLNGAGEPTGEVVPKAEAHRLGLRHGCFHCWIVDPEGPYLLVQRRAADKEVWPGRLDVTAAGHLRAGEGPLDGLRELEEELGLVASPEDLIPLGTRYIDEEIPTGRDREFHEVYLLLRPIRPEDVKLQVEEVEAVLRVPLEDAALLGESETLPAEELGGNSWFDRRIRRWDFVPDRDECLPKVAREALRLLDGKSPRRVFYAGGAGRPSMRR
jgi:isopentenyldiphosphate isomerase